MKSNVILWIRICAVILRASVVVAAQPAGWFATPRQVEGIQRDHYDFTQCVTADNRLIVFNSNGTLYQATRNTSDEAFQNVTPLGSTINTSSYEETGPALTGDGLVLVFQRDPPGPTDNTSTEMNLFEARRPTLREPFGIATLLPVAINRYSAFTPYLSSNGLVLLFGSTRPGGLGMEDIWVATRTSLDEPFDDPVNFNDFFAGSEVNSQFQELSPCLSSDGLALFFAEYEDPRAGGKGKGDIWVCTRQDQASAFGPPVNLNDVGLGSVVNTASREGFLFVSRDWPRPGSKLYFTSDRASGNYQFDFWETTWTPLQISTSRPEVWGAYVEVSAKPGAMVEVQYTSELEPSGWTSLAGRLVAESNSVAIGDVAGKFGINRFYRATIPDSSFAKQIAGSYLGTIAELKLQVLLKLGADGTSLRVSNADAGLDGQAPFASRTLATGTWTQTGSRAIRIVEVGFEFDAQGNAASLTESGKAVVDLVFGDNDSASGSLELWSYESPNDPFFDLLTFPPRDRTPLGTVGIRKIK